jgi:capsular polysaccharide transport system permease protein
MASRPKQQVTAHGTGIQRRFAGARSIMALILREMSTRYGRAPGGYIWALLEPMGAIIMLSLGFSLVMKTPPLGNSFVLFFATGFLPLSLFLGISNMVARSIRFSRPLLAYPAVSWIDALLARFILNGLTNILVIYLLFIGILAVTDTRTVLNLDPIILSMFLCLLLGLGIGTLNCVLGGLYPAWEMIWSIATRPLFLASGVFYTYESLPRVVQDILWWNPILHIVSMMRTGFYPMYRAPHVSITFVLLTSMITLLLGILLMRRHHRALLLM